MPPFLHFLVPAAVAGLAAALVRFLARWRTGLLPLALPVGLLGGAVALTLPFNLRAVWAPRVMVDHLVLVALAGLAAATVGTRMRRRWVAPFALAFVTGWWVAHSPPALGEFWRAGLVVTLGVLVLLRSPAAALLAASVAGFGACVLAGTAPVWQGAMLVAVGACAGVLGAAAPAWSAAAFVAATGALLSLAGGRAVSGRVTAADGVALVPFVVALGWPFVARRLPGVLNRARPNARVAVRRRRA